MDGNWCGMGRNLIGLIIEYMCLARWLPVYKNTVNSIYSQNLIKLNIVEHESLNEKIKGTPNKAWSPDLGIHLLRRWLCVHLYDSDVDKYGCD